MKLKMYVYIRTSPTVTPMWVKMHFCFIAWSGDKNIMNSNRREQQTQRKEKKPSK